MLICAAALAARLIYAFALAPDLAGIDDDTFYHLAALDLADGNGYVGSFDVFTSGAKEPTADHPPLYPLLLSFLARLGARSVDAQRILGVCAGTLTVLAVGLVARRVGGYRAGLAAAGLCALYPAFIAADGAIMSETLFGALVAFALLLALIQLERPSLIGMTALGALVGLAALTRSEGLLLLPLLAVPILIAAPARRIALAAALVAATALVVAPWVARNWDVFGEPVYSTNDGATLAGANCDATYHGAATAGFEFSCIEDVRQPRTNNRAVRSRRLREAGVDYAREHFGRAVVVGGLRFARVWGFYRPASQADVTGRHEGVQRAGVLIYYVVLAAGVVGALVLRRRRRTLALGVLLAPILLSSVAAVSTYGLLRLRHISEISLIVLAGVAVAYTRSRRRRRAAAATL